MDDDHFDLIFVGSLPPTPDGGEGITTVRRDRRSGELSAPRLAAVTPAPSFLARHPARPVLYAVNEQPDGALSAFRVAPDGGLSPLGSAPTGDAGPCHVAVHPSGRYAVCANYAGGSVAVLPLADTDTGTSTGTSTDTGAGAPAGPAELVRHTGGGPDPDRQAGPHPHMVAFGSPEGVSVVDLGTDTVVHHRLTPTGGLTPAGATRTRPGTGPRHVAGIGAGLAYLVGELDGTITSFQVDAAGRWRERDRLALCAPGDGYPSEVAVSPDRRFVYAAVRGPDVIAVFAARGGGRLRPVAQVPCGGHWPRHFALVDQHLYVANERSGSVVTFRVDPATGVPAPTGNWLDLPSPSCVLRFVRS